MELDSHDKRRDVRYGVFEHCRVAVKGREFEGLLVDMSLGVASLRVDVQL